MFKLLRMQECSHTLLSCCDKNKVRALLLRFCFCPQNHRISCILGVFFLEILVLCHLDNLDLGLLGWY